MSSSTQGLPQCHLNHGFADLDHVATREAAATANHPFPGRRSRSPLSAAMENGASSATCLARHSKTSITSSIKCEVEQWRSCQTCVIPSAHLWVLMDSCFRSRGMAVQDLQVRVRVTSDRVAACVSSPGDESAGAGVGGGDHECFGLFEVFDCLYDPFHGWQGLCFECRREGDSCLHGDPCIACS